MDIWISWDQKYKLFVKSFGIMIKITPYIFEDLKKCDEIVENLEEVTEWLNANTDLTFSIKNMGANMLKNWLQIGGLSMSITYKAASKDWEGLGHDIGEVTKNLIELPPSTDDTKKTKK